MPARTRISSGWRGGRPAGRPAPKLGPDGVKLGQLVVIQRGDDQAAPSRLSMDCVSPLQRLADRRARDAETLGQLGSHQPVVGAIDAIVDGIGGSGNRRLHVRHDPAAARDCKRPAAGFTQMPWIFSMSPPGSSTSTTRFMRPRCGFFADRTPHDRLCHARGRRPGGRGQPAARSLLAPARHHAGGADGRTRHCPPPPTCARSMTSTFPR